jgi:hypothetical protein
MKMTLTDKIRNVTAGILALGVTLVPAYSANAASTQDVQRAKELVKARDWKSGEIYRFGGVGTGHGRDLGFNFEYDSQTDELKVIKRFGLEKSGRNRVDRQWAASKGKSGTVYAVGAEVRSYPDEKVIRTLPHFNSYAGQRIFDDGIATLLEEYSANKK